MIRNVIYRDVCLKQRGPGPASMEVCASVLARACKSVAGEVVAANGGAAGSPVPLPGDHRKNHSLD